MEDLRTIICQKCGKEFQVGRGSTGKWLRRKWCPDCSDYQKTEKLVQCKFCGKEFTVYRTADNRHWAYNNYKCPKCTLDYQQEMKEKTKTLVCQKCGKEFQVKRSKISGNFLLRKYCFNCDTANKPYKLAKCVTCGKEFKQYRTLCGDFSQSKYCSYQCSLIQKKTKICVVCGKEFELERSTNTGNFKDNVKYCSDKCAKIGWRNLTKQTCQEKYGVDLPCLSPNCMKNNPTNSSKISDEFYNFLLNNNFKVEREFILGSYTYDFKINNILIELNPTFTHTCIDTGVYPPKDKYSHYNKSKLAKNNNYVCLCVWDWTDWDNLVSLLKQDNLQMIETDIKLYYTKNKISIESNNPNDENLLKDNYLPIYTDGYLVK